MGKLFDELNDVFTKKVDTISNPYMLNRFLSFYPKTFLFVSELNRFMARLPKWAIVAMYNYGFKKLGRAPYINYAKVTKRTEPKLVDKVANALNCNERHARETIDLLRKMGHKPEQFFGLKKGE
ncbi:hypothetical protein AYK24_06615 [Thermoplasmatales archaeon SG8-52-4]|nr:MAG: hypothetical protein AYK24_06615 [Thermoplasmatales archaeon SG8-52-4]